MKRVKKSKHRINQRDLRIILFLWKFRVATTAMLHQKFFSDTTSRNAYNTLLKLRGHSYIATRTDEYGKDPLWSIDRKGLELIKEYIPETKSNNLKLKNKEKDLLCSGILQGEFLKEIPEEVELITEQMLTVYQNGLLPKYIPDMTEHTPKGYWCFKNENKNRLVSLEIEVTRMSKLHYLDSSYFYKDFSENSRVFWVVKDSTQVKDILFLMYEACPKYKVHNFVLLKDIYKNGWHAEIIGGMDKNKILRDVLLQNSLSTAGLTLVKCFQDYMLDRRLTYRNHSQSPSRQKTNFADSMDILL